MNLRGGQGGLRGVGDAEGGGGRGRERVEGRLQPPQRRLGSRLGLRLDLGEGLPRLPHRAHRAHHILRDAPTAGPVGLVGTTDALVALEVPVRVGEPPRYLMARGGHQTALWPRADEHASTDEAESRGSSYKGRLGRKQVGLNQIGPRLTLTLTLTLIITLTLTLTLVIPSYPNPNPNPRVLDLARGP